MLAANALDVLKQLESREGHSKGLAHAALWIPVAQ